MRMHARPHCRCHCPRQVQQSSSLHCVCKSQIGRERALDHVWGAKKSLPANFRARSGTSARVASLQNQSLQHVVLQISRLQVGRILTRGVQHKWGKEFFGLVTVRIGESIWKETVAEAGEHTRSSQQTSRNPLPSVSIHLNKWSLKCRAFDGERKTWVRAVVRRYEHAAKNSKRTDAVLNLCMHGKRLLVVWGRSRAVFERQDAQMLRYRHRNCRSRPWGTWTNRVTYIRSQYA